MIAHDLSRHYENANRTIHHEKPPPEFAIKMPRFDGLALFEQDGAMITALMARYPVYAQPIPQPIPGRPQSCGFRARLKSRLPEIRILMDAGESAGDVGEKLGMSETTVRRAFRHLRGEPSDEKNAVSVIGVHKITGEVVEFPSMSQAENYGGFLGSKIGLCLLGQASHHKGYIWRRAA